MKFLVCRTAAIRPNGYMRTSDHFPMEIDISPDEFSQFKYLSLEQKYEQIVRKAMDSINKGYVGMHDYIVVPLEEAMVVSFRKPQPSYEVNIREY